jgi:hypothetical protein
LLARRNRKLPSKRHLRSKLLRSQQHRSPKEPNQNHAKNLHPQSRRLRKCEGRERLRPSATPILLHHKRGNLANQIPRLLQRRVQLSLKLQGRLKKKPALNRQTHRIGQVHELQSRTRLARYGPRLWNPEEWSPALRLCQKGKRPRPKQRLRFLLVFFAFSEHEYEY